MRDYSQNDKEKLIADLKHEVKLSPINRDLKSALEEAEHPYLNSLHDIRKWKRTLSQAKDKRGDQAERLVVSKAKLNSLKGYLGHNDRIKMSLKNIDFSIKAQQKDIVERIKDAKNADFVKELDILSEAYTTIENILQHIKTFYHSNSLALLAINKGAFPIEQRKGEVYRLGEPMRLQKAKDKKLKTLADQLKKTSALYKERPTENTWAKLAKQYLDIWLLTHKP